MDVLPWFLYLFRMLPILIPKAFFLNLCAAIRRYGCASTPAGIEYDILSHPKAHGGVGLPNLKLYYRLAQIIWVIDWFHKSGVKVLGGNWGKIVSYTLMLATLDKTWWSQLSGFPMFIVAFRETWDLQIRTSDLSSYVGPLTLIMGNSVFLLSCAGGAGAPPHCYNLPRMGRCCRW